MTTEGLLEYLINEATRYNIRCKVDEKFIDELMKRNGLTLESLVGLLCGLALRYNHELSAERDEKEIYAQRAAASKKTLEQLQRSQNLSSYQVKNLKQKNGAPTAKKFNESKFKMYIQMGASKKEIMSALKISESTYYRLFRAYKATM